MSDKEKAVDIAEDPQFIENVTNLAHRAVRGEVIVKEELGITDGQMEAMYAVAYSQFQNEKYQDAARTFSLLCMFDPLEYKYMFGIASCLHMIGEYESASLYYFMACGLDERQVAPFLHIAECMVALKDKEGAEDALTMTLEKAGDLPEYAPIRQRAEVILENLSD